MKMEQLSKTELKEYVVSEEQRMKAYEVVNRMTNEDYEEVSPALLKMVLNSAKGALKNDLGRVLFQLQKTEQLDTKFGVEKLVEGALLVAPENLFKILESVN